jgi:glutathione-specific gamma-glutamylcyclotransferase
MSGMAGRRAITREGLLDGSHLAEVRAAAAAAGVRLASDGELEASLAAALAAHDPAADAWLFGYGSLMWNPAIRYAERRVATVRGWHRRYCLWVRAGRGSADCPGLTLGLDRGGSCRGVAFRIAAAEVRDELRLAWRREMLSGAYVARWVGIRCDDGHEGRAIAFVVNRRHERYVRGLTEADIAERIAIAAGRLGSCAEYLEETVAHLGELGLADPGLERLRTQVATRRAAAGG